MKKILVFGAGRSATTLIWFLGEHAKAEQWEVTIADASAELVHEKIRGYPALEGVTANVQSARERSILIGKHDFVISMLPWTLHTLVARDCLRLGKHLITASYVNEEMRAFHARAKKKGLFFMGELGLDPGLDHMSALQLIRKIKDDDGEITSFHSYAGGLIAPSCDTNPWHYKITWNPRNIVLAGQGTIQYRHQGHLRLIPYHQLFQSAIPIAIGEEDRYEVYPNRDSLRYISLYGLTGVPSIMRGTVRIRGFSHAWSALVQIGLTEHQTPLGVDHEMTWNEFISGFLSRDNELSLRERCADYLQIPAHHVVMDQLEWLGLFSDRPIGPLGLTPADYLQRLLEEKWKLDPEDRDLVVMEHRIQYRHGGELKELRSTLHHEGASKDKTAMADLVGLPLAHATRLFLQGKLNDISLPVPFEPAITTPLLDALSYEGVTFLEREVPPEDHLSFHQLSIGMHER